MTAMDEETADRLRILIVNDDEEDFLRTREMFLEIPELDLALEWISGYEEAADAIGRKEHDLYFLDYRLGPRTGLELLRGAMEVGVEAPVILLTGEGDREVDVAAMKLGATAYLLKDRIEPEQLERTIRYALNQKRSEREILELAHHDALTGLPNRLLFNDRLSRAIAHAARFHHRLAVLFLDLDDFKQVNDTLGHAAGDQLLQDVAERLSRCVRLTDSVARQAEFRPAMGRLGGDEFILLLTNIDHVDSVAMVAQRVLREVGKVLCELPGSISTSTSIGIALYPDDGEDVETLINNADTAMYHAKRRGKGVFRFYNSEMEAHARDRLGLRDALAEGELSLSYLPAVTLAEGELIALEPLPRWTHRLQGVIEPDLLRALAAQTGLANVLDRWVLEAGTRQARGWRRQGIACPLVVSLGSQSLSSDALLSLRGMFEEGDTEMIHVAVAAGMLNQPGPYLPELLAALGVGLVIDDFGASPFVIRALIQLPLRMIWLGAPLSQGVLSNDDDRETIRAVTALAHALGCRVVARGIATEEQRRCLLELGCSGGQGPLMGGPLTLDELTSRVAGDNRPP
jgi:diguanylate cyclase (GGDEF)-like protein